METQKDDVITKKCKWCGHSFQAFGHYDTYKTCVVCEAGQKRCVIAAPEHCMHNEAIACRGNHGREIICIHPKGPESGGAPNGHGCKNRETYEIHIMNKYVDLKAAVSLALNELEKFDNICWGYDGDCGSKKIVERAIDYLENQIKPLQTEPQEPEAFPIQIQPDGSASI